jgi:RNA polymerase sigma-70 factor (ECF subfamily)
LSEPTDQDAALMAAIAEGDHDAFDVLVRRHLDSIHGYLYRLTGSPTDAEDLAQDTFIRVWQKAGSYQPGRAKLTTWLHTIAHRRTMDVFRKRRELPFPDGLELPDPEADPSADYEAGENRLRLAKALSALPEGQRAAILLCQMQGFSNAQAAEILGLQVRALESLLARARRALRERLNESGVLGGRRRGRPDTTESD